MNGWDCHGTTRAVQLAVDVIQAITCVCAGVY